MGGLTLPANGTVYLDANGFIYIKDFVANSSPVLPQ